MRGISILLVETGLYLELPDTEVMVTTYSVNDFSSIESREVHYTNTFKIPLTQANVEALGLPQHINTFSRLPYELISVKIIEDNISVLEGTLKIVDVKEGFIDCEITGGNYNFFELIDGKKLSELDLSGLSHEWSLASISNSIGNTWEDGYTYPMIDFGRNMGEYKTVDDCFPALYVKYVLNNIARSNKFRIKGGFWDSDVMERLIMLPYKLPSLDDDYTKAHSMRLGYTSFLVYPWTASPGSTNELVVQPSNGLKMDYTDSEAFDYFVGENMTYSTSSGVGTVTAPGIYKNEIKVVVGYQSVVWIKAFVYRNGVQYQEIKYKRSSQFGKSELFDFIFDPAFFDAGDTVSIVLKLQRAGNFLQGGRGSIFLDNQTAWGFEMTSYVVPGATIDPTSILPDDEQKNLFLLIANQFNLLFITDTTKKILYIEQFDKVIKNYPGVDFSDRLDFSEPPELNYNLDGYGQNTILEYDAEQYPGSITIDNKHLDPSVVGYESGFKLQEDPILTMKDNTRFTVWRENSEYSNDPIQDYVYYQGKYFRAEENNSSGDTPVDSSGNWEEIDYWDYLQLTTLDSVSSPIALLDTDNVEVYTVFDGTDSLDIVNNITIEPLKFSSLIPRYYRYLGAALNNGKFVKVKLRIDSTDIATIDFTKPIRLQSDHLRYGEMVTGYFFLQSIEEYAHGYPGSTWVNLMRIEKASLTSVTKATFEEGYLLLPDSGYFLQPDEGRLRLPDQ